MLARVMEGSSPIFSFACAEVLSVQMIPKECVTREVLEVRRPLRSGARREGWVGYNLLHYKIPSSSRVVLVD